MKMNMKWTYRPLLPLPYLFSLAWFHRGDVSVGGRGDSEALPDSGL